MNEILFSSDTRAESAPNGLSISEYVAIGISSVLLGFIYVASVLLYLHIRKRRKESKSEDHSYDDKNLASMEEGVVKNNPLLGLGRHFPVPDFNDSASSDTDHTADPLKHDKCHDKHVRNEFEN